MADSCASPASISSRTTKLMPPAAWNWFTSASPFGYTRASSGVTREMSAMSSQVMVRPQARAMATRWITWLVEPPVAIESDDGVHEGTLVDDLDEG